MALLKLSLLGPFIASYNKQPLQNLRTNKVQALFIYLAVEKDRAHPRESLMELLWPGMPLESAQVNLRQTIYRLRKAIPEVSNISSDERVPLVLSDRQSVQLNPEAAIDLDVFAFRTLIEEDPAKAVKLYRGDFLSDFYLVDSSDFEAWAERTRERLRREMLDVLDVLAKEAIEAGDHYQAQTYAWRQLEIDSLRESAYRQLMKALAEGGQRNAALAQYQVCRRRLVRELGLEPSTETTTLYEKIQVDALKTTKEPPPVRVLGPGEMPVFMLTDIEGSTRLWDTYRQAMLPALFTHNQILGDQISKHGGRILELRGDGVKAVFEGVSPLDCVLDIQRALGEANWGEIGDLRIRIGLHGVPPVHKDFDYFIEDNKYYGPVLNHTARIMDAGHGGQILVSEQIYNAFSLPQGASWQDFKHHHVKGLEQPVHIYGLVHPDLPLQSFPPLRTGITPTEIPPVGTAGVRHNLVPQLTPFIGRHEELSKLDDMLQDPDTRLITITGPGGMGKTRLAIACAERQLTRKPGDGDEHQFPDGIFFVPLADIEDPDQIPSEFAKALNLSLNPGGIPERERFTIEQQLMGYLRRKGVLFVLDNFEQLLDGMDLLMEILQTAPNVQMLVTSRERLHLQVEQAFPIEGLGFPDWEAPEDPSNYTAMQLFLESARRVRPDFKITTNDMVYLTRICYQLGGMPLGLELAASWVNLLSVEEIAVELKKGLDLLETDARDLPARHRSLQVVCDSTWKRLNSTEQDVFARLSAFRGGFTRKAAQEVTGTSIRSLAALQNKSLLGYNPTKKRYYIHPYLRRYGLDQLKSMPGLDFEARDRHTAFFSELAEKGKTEYELGNPELAVKQMGVEIANIRAAWDWAITQKYITRIDQSIYGLCYYFLSNFHIQEAIDICRKVNELLSEMLSMPDFDAHPNAKHIMIKRVRSKALILQGFLRLNLDREHLFDAYLHTQPLYEREQIYELFKSSQQILTELKNVDEDVRAEEAQLLCYQAIPVLDFENAKVLFEKSISLAEEINDHYLEFNGLIRLGTKAYQNRFVKEAKSWFERGLILARLHEQQRFEVTFLVYLGTTNRRLIDYEEAIQYYEEAIFKSKTYGISYVAFYALYTLGSLLLFLGHLEQAKTKFLEAITYAEGTGLASGVSTIATLSVAQWLAGEFEKAEETILGALELLSDHKYSPSFYANLAYIELIMLEGQYTVVFDKIQWESELGRDYEMYNHIYRGRLSRIRSWFTIIDRDYSRAKFYLIESINCFQIDYDDESIAWSQVFLALAEFGLGNPMKAKEILKEALSTSIEIQGYIPMVFSLPVTLLILADENRELGVKVYDQVMRDPFLGKARLFKDIVYKYLPEEITSIPVKTVATSPQHREKLWEAARKVLASWQDGTHQEV